MLKSLKKLKFWSKKRKRKTKTHHHSLPHHSPPPPSRPPPPPPPPPCHRAEPSAPPLPPSWKASEFYAFSTADYNDTDIDTCPLVTLWPDESSSSFVGLAGPVFGIPVAERAAAEGEKLGGLLGFGIKLIGCFLPCYRV